jgi:hypothetical protein
VGGGGLLIRSFLVRKGHCRGYAGKAFSELENAMGSAAYGRLISNKYYKDSHDNLMISPIQGKDRMGRDVAFYNDGIGFENIKNIKNIKNIEHINWRVRGKIKAGNVGLGDDKLMPAYVPGKSIKFPIPDGQTNSNETYPAAVLNPVYLGQNLHGQN